LKVQKVLAQREILSGKVPLCVVCNSAATTQTKKAVKKRRRKRGDNGIVIVKTGVMGLSIPLEL